MKTESLSLVSEILVSKLRRDDAGILEWWSPVADTLATDGQFIELESMGRMVFDRVSSVKGSLSEDALKALTIWARGAYRNGASAEVVRTLEPIVESFGAGSNGTRRYLRGALAVALWRNGQLERSQTILELLHSDALKELGEEHPEVATYANNLSTLYRANGKPKQAVTLLQKVVQDGTLTGDVAAKAKLNLAQVYLELEDYGSAARLFDEIALYFRERNRTAEEVLATYSWSLAVADSGAFQLLIERLSEQLEHFRRKLGPFGPDVLLFEEQLAFAYYRLGRSEVALDLQKKLVATLRSQGDRSTQLERAEDYLRYYQSENSKPDRPGERSGEHTDRTGQTAPGW